MIYVLKSTRQNNKQSGLGNDMVDLYHTKETKFNDNNVVYISYGSYDEMVDLKNKINNTITTIKKEIRVIEKQYLNITYGLCNSTYGLGNNLCDVEDVSNILKQMDVEKTNKTRHLYEKLAIIDLPNYEIIKINKI